MFVFLSLVCFLCGVLLPFHNESWDPFAMGPIVVCSAVCVTLLTLQIWEIYWQRSGLFFGQMYLLWSMLHMMAALSSLGSENMLSHFLFQFSSVCWQVSNQIAHGQAAS